jgi:hypothetical protein
MEGKIDANRQTDSQIQTDRQTDTDKYEDTTYLNELPYFFSTQRRCKSLRSSIFVMICYVIPFDP